ncbi:MAG: hypothetical protein IKC03_09270 [Oscillospiraceae bacterium]|nr:hypothetical protein [Oscillospiraceae bacterium]
MDMQVNVHADIYKKFQAALLLTDEHEDTVLNRLLEDYAHNVFTEVLTKRTITVSTEITQEPKPITVNNTTAIEQKKLFVSWFRGLTRNGKAYNPVTISGYAGRIENACSDSVFASVPVNNLFTVTDLTQFMHFQKQIKESTGYAEFDAKCHNGLTAALKKYEEFLKFQMENNRDS